MGTLKSLQWYGNPKSKGLLKYVNESTPEVIMTEYNAVLLPSTHTQYGEGEKKKIMFGCPHVDLKNINGLS